MKPRKYSTAAALCGLALTAASAQGAATIYEPFDYATGVINGTQGTTQPGGTGLTGDWSGTTSGIPYSILSPGLDFTGLSTTGNRLQRATAPGSAQISRGLTVAAQTSLTADNTTIYFSLLLQNNRFSTGNANDSFIFGSGPVTNADSNPVTLAGSEGFGIATKPGSGAGTIDISGIAIDGGVTTESTGIIDDNDTGGGAATYFIVGRIDWLANGSNDTLRLYNVSDVNTLPTAFATMTADLDQSLFGTLAFGGEQIAAFDEIRFGETLSDVGVVPEPSVALLSSLGALALLRRRRK